MKRITLAKIRESLENDRYEVIVDPDVAARALLPIERMLAVG
jgi:quinolinate synthase